MIPLDEAFVLNLVLENYNTHRRKDINPELKMSDLVLAYKQTNDDRIDYHVLITEKKNYMYYEVRNYPDVNIWKVIVRHADTAIATFRIDPETGKEIPRG